jgi:hypothetical protein
VFSKIDQKLRANHAGGPGNKNFQVYLRSSGGIGAPNVTSVVDRCLSSFSLKKLIRRSASSSSAVARLILKLTDNPSTFIGLVPNVFI